MREYQPRKALHIKNGSSTQALVRKTIKDEPKKAKPENIFVTYLKLNKLGGF